jgi:hypothetical protein
VKQQQIEDIKQKLITALILFVYFFNTFGQAVVAQVNLGLGSSLQKKFSSEQDMMDYMSKLSAEDKYKFMNSSTTVCTQSGEQIFTSENRSTYKFLCFVNNVQDINLQLTIHILNVGKNDYDFLGYETSDEKGIKFEGYGSLKFTVYNQSRVVFSYLISSKNIPGIDVDTNQGKTVVMSEYNDFETFINTLHDTETVLLLKHAYEEIFGTSSAASYSTTNIQTSDSSVQNILNLLSSPEIFSLVSGQTVEKNNDSAAYTLSFDKTNEKIIAKSGDQTVGTADVSMSFVPLTLPSLNVSSNEELNTSLALLVANITQLNSTAGLMANNQSESNITGQIVLPNFDDILNSLFGNLIGKSVKAEDSESDSLSIAEIKYRVLFYPKIGEDSETGKEIYAKVPAIKEFSDFKSALDFLRDRWAENSKSLESIALIFYKGNTITIVDFNPFVIGRTSETIGNMLSNMINRMKETEGKLIGGYHTHTFTAAGYAEFSSIDLRGIVNDKNNYDVEKILEVLWSAGDGVYVFSTPTLSQLENFQNEIFSDSNKENLKSSEWLREKVSEAMKKVDFNTLMATELPGIIEEAKKAPEEIKSSELRVGNLDDIEYDLLKGAALKDLGTVNIEGESFKIKKTVLEREDATYVKYFIYGADDLQEGHVGVEISGKETAFIDGLSTTHEYTKLINYLIEFVASDLAKENIGKLTVNINEGWSRSEQTRLILEDLGFKKIGEKEYERTVDRIFQKIQQKELLLTFERLSSEPNKYLNGKSIVLTEQDLKQTRGEEGAKIEELGMVTIGNQRFALGKSFIEASNFNQIDYFLYDENNNLASRISLSTANENSVELEEEVGVAQINGFGTAAIYKGKGLEVKLLEVMLDDLNNGGIRKVKINLFMTKEGNEFLPILESFGFEVTSIDADGEIKVLEKVISFEKEFGHSFADVRDSFYAIVESNPSLSVREAFLRALKENNIPAPVQKYAIYNLDVLLSKNPSLSKDKIIDLVLIGGGLPVTGTTSGTVITDLIGAIKQVNNFIVEMPGKDTQQFADLNSALNYLVKEHSSSLEFEAEVFLKDKTLLFRSTDDVAKVSSNSVRINLEDFKNIIQSKEIQGFSYVGDLHSHPILNALVNIFTSLFDSKFSYGDLYNWKNSYANRLYGQAESIHFLYSYNSGKFSVAIATNEIERLPDLSRFGLLNALASPFVQNYVKYVQLDQLIGIATGTTSGTENQLPFWQITKNVGNSLFGSENFAIKPMGSAAYASDTSGIIPRDRISDAEFTIIIDDKLVSSAQSVEDLESRFADNLVNELRSRGFTVDIAATTSGKKLYLHLGDQSQLPVTFNIMKLSEIRKGGESLIAFSKTYFQTGFIASDEFLGKLADQFSKAGIDLAYVKQSLIDEYLDILNNAEWYANEAELTNTVGNIEGPHKFYKRLSEIAWDEQLRLQLLQKYDEWNDYIDSKLKEGLSLSEINAIIKPTLIKEFNGLKPQFSEDIARSKIEANIQVVEIYGKQFFVLKGIPDYTKINLELVAEITPSSAEPATGTNTGTQENPSDIKTSSSMIEDYILLELNQGKTLSQALDTILADKIFLQRLQDFIENYPELPTVEVGIDAKIRTDMNDFTKMLQEMGIDRDAINYVSKTQLVLNTDSTGTSETTEGSLVFSFNIPSAIREARIMSGDFNSNMDYHIALTASHELAHILSDYLKVPDAEHEAFAEAMAKRFMAYEGLDYQPTQDYYLKQKVFLDTLGADQIFGKEMNSFVQKLPPSLKTFYGNDIRMMFAGNNWTTSAYIIDLINKLPDSEMEKLLGLPEGGFSKKLPSETQTATGTSSGTATFSPPDSNLVSAILEKVDSDKPLTDQDVEILIQKTVFDVHEALTKKYGPDIFSSENNLVSNAFSYRMSQLVGEKNIGNKLLVEISEPNPLNPDITNKHVFVLVAREATGRIYLVDLTFSQFFKNDAAPSLANGGTIMKEVPKGNEVVNALLKNGYVEITDDVARVFCAGLSDGKYQPTAKQFIEEGTYGPDLARYRKAIENLFISKDDMLRFYNYRVVGKNVELSFTPVSPLTNNEATLLENARRIVNGGPRVISFFSGNSEKDTSGAYSIDFLRPYFGTNPQYLILVDKNLDVEKAIAQISSDVSRIGGHMSGYVEKSSDAFAVHFYRGTGSTTVIGIRADARTDSLSDMFDKMSKIYNVPNGFFIDVVFERLPLEPSENYNALLKTLLSKPGTFLITDDATGTLDLAKTNGMEEINLKDLIDLTYSGKDNKMHIAFQPPLDKVSLFLDVVRLDGELKQLTFDQLGFTETKHIEIYQALNEMSNDLYLLGTYTPAEYQRVQAAIKRIFNLYQNSFDMYKQGKISLDGIKSSYEKMIGELSPIEPFTGRALMPNVDKEEKYVSWEEVPTLHTVWNIMHTQILTDSDLFDEIGRNGYGLNSITGTTLVGSTDVYTDKIVEILKEISVRTPFYSAVVVNEGEGNIDLILRPEGNVGHAGTVDMNLNEKTIYWRLFLVHATQQEAQLSKDFLTTIAAQTRLEQIAIPIERPVILGNSGFDDDNKLKSLLQRIAIITGPGVTQFEKDGKKLENVLTQINSAPDIKSAEAMVTKTGLPINSDQITRIRYLAGPELENLANYLNWGGDLDQGLLEVKKMGGAQATPEKFAASSLIGTYSGTDQANIEKLKTAFPEIESLVNSLVERNQDSIDVLADTVLTLGGIKLTGLEMGEEARLNNFGEGLLKIANKYGITFDYRVLSPSEVPLYFDNSKRSFEEMHQSFGRATSVKPFIIVYSADKNLLMQQVANVQAGDQTAIGKSLLIYDAGVGFDKTVTTEPGTLDSLLVDTYAKTGNIDPELAAARGIVTSSYSAERTLILRQKISFLASVNPDFTSVWLEEGLTSLRTAMEFSDEQSSIMHEECQEASDQLSQLSGEKIIQYVEEKTQAEVAQIPNTATGTTGSSNVNFMDLLAQAAGDILGPDNFVLVPQGEMTYRDLQSVSSVRLNLIYDYDSLTPDLKTKIQELGGAAELEKEIWSRFGEIASPYGFKVSSITASTNGLTFPNGRMIEDFGLKFETLSDVGTDRMSPLEKSLRDGLTIDSTTNEPILPSLYAGIYGTDNGKIKFLQKVSQMQFSALKQKYSFGKDYFVADTLDLYVNLFEQAELSAEASHFTFFVNPIITSVDTVDIHGPHEFYFTLAWMSALIDEPKSVQDGYLTKGQEWEDKIRQRLTDFKPNLEQWKTNKETITSKELFEDELTKEFQPQIDSEWQKLKTAYADFGKAKGVFENNAVEEKIGSQSSWRLVQFTKDHYNLNNLAASNQNQAPPVSQPSNQKQVATGTTSGNQNEIPNLNVKIENGNLIIDSGGKTVTIPEEGIRFTVSGTKIIQPLTMKEGETYSSVLFDGIKGKLATLVQTAASLKNLPEIDRAKALTKIIEDNLVYPYTDVIAQIQNIDPAAATFGKNQNSMLTTNLELSSAVDMGIGCCRFNAVLFQALAEAAGLKSTIVSGSVKNVLVKISGDVTQDVANAIGQISDAQFNSILSGNPLQTGDFTLRATNKQLQTTFEGHTININRKTIGVFDKSGNLVAEYEPIFKGYPIDEQSFIDWKNPGDHSWNEVLLSDGSILVVDATVNLNGQRGLVEQLSAANIFKNYLPKDISAAVITQDIMANNEIRLTVTPIQDLLSRYASGTTEMSEILEFTPLVWSQLPRQKIVTLNPTTYTGVINLQIPLTSFDYFARRMIQMSSVTSVEKSVTKSTIDAYVYGKYLESNDLSYGLKTRAEFQAYMQTPEGQQFYTQEALKKFGVTGGSGTATGTAVGTVSSNNYVPLTQEQTDFLTKYFSVLGMTLSISPVGTMVMYDGIPITAFGSDQQTQNAVLSQLPYFFTVNNVNGEKYIILKSAFTDNWIYRGIEGPSAQQIAPNSQENYADVSTVLMNYINQGGLGRPRFPNDPYDKAYYGNSEYGMPTSSLPEVSLLKYGPTEPPFTTKDGALILLKREVFQKYNNIINPMNGQGMAAKGEIFFTQLVPLSEVDYILVDSTIRNQILSEFSANPALTQKYGKDLVILGNKPLKDVLIPMDWSGTTYDPTTGNNLGILQSSMEKILQLSGAIMIDNSGKIYIPLNQPGNQPIVETTSEIQSTTSPDISTMTWSDFQQIYDRISTDLTIQGYNPKNVDIESNLKNQGVSYEKGDSFFYFRKGIFLGNVNGNSDVGRFYLTIRPEEAAAAMKFVQDNSKDIPDLEMKIPVDMNSYGKVGLSVIYFTKSGQTQGLNLLREMYFLNPHFFVVTESPPFTENILDYLGLVIPGVGFGVESTTANTPGTIIKSAFIQTMQQLRNDYPSSNPPDSVVLQTLIDNINKISGNTRNPYDFAFNMQDTGWDVIKAVAATNVHSVSVVDSMSTDPIYNVIKQRITQMIGDQFLIQLRGTSAFFGFNKDYVGDLELGVGVTQEVYNAYAKSKGLDPNNNDLVKKAFFDEFFEKDKLDPLLKSLPTMYLSADEIDITTDPKILAKSPYLEKVYHGIRLSDGRTLILDPVNVDFKTIHDLVVKSTGNYKFRLDNSVIGPTDLENQYWNEVKTNVGLDKARDDMITQYKSYFNDVNEIKEYTVPQLANGWEVETPAKALKRTVELLMMLNAPQYLIDAAKTSFIYWDTRFNIELNQMLKSSGYSTIVDLRASGNPELYTWSAQSRSQYKQDLAQFYPYINPVYTFFGYQTRILEVSFTDRMKSNIIQVGDKYLVLGLQNAVQVSQVQPIATINENVKGISPNIIPPSPSGVSAVPSGNAVPSATQNFFAQIDQLVNAGNLDDAVALAQQNGITRITAEIVQHFGWQSLTLDNFALDEYRIGIRDATALYYATLIRNGSPLQPLSGNAVDTVILDATKETVRNDLENRVIAQVAIKPETTTGAQSAAQAQGTTASLPDTIRQMYDQTTTQSTTQEASFLDLFSEQLLDKQTVDKLQQLTQLDGLIRDSQLIEANYIFASSESQTVRNLELVNSFDMTIAQIEDTIVGMGLSQDDELAVRNMVLNQLNPDNIAPLLPGQFEGNIGSAWSQNAMPVINDMLGNALGTTGQGPNLIWVKPTMVPKKYIPNPWMELKSDMQKAGLGIYVRSYINKIGGTSFVTWQKISEDKYTRIEVTYNLNANQNEIVESTRTTTEYTLNKAVDQMQLDMQNGWGEDSVNRVIVVLQLRKPGPITVFTNDNGYVLWEKTPDNKLQRTEVRTAPRTGQNQPETTRTITVYSLDDPTVQEKIVDRLQIDGAVNNKIDIDTLTTFKNLVNVQPLTRYSISFLPIVLADRVVYYIKTSNGKFFRAVAIDDKIQENTVKEYDKPSDMVSQLQNDLNSAKAQSSVQSLELLFGNDNTVKIQPQSTAEASSPATKLVPGAQRFLNFINGLKLETGQTKTLVATEKFNLAITKTAENELNIKMTRNTNGEIKVVINNNGDTTTIANTLAGENEIRPELFNNIDGLEKPTETTAPAVAEATEAEPVEPLTLRAKCLSGLDTSSLNLFPGETVEDRVVRMAQVNGKLMALDLAYSEGVPKDVSQIAYANGEESTFGPSFPKGQVVVGMENGKWKITPATATKKATLDLSADGTRASDVTVDSGNGVKTTVTEKSVGEVTFSRGDLQGTMTIKGDTYTLDITGEDSVNFEQASLESAIKNAIDKGETLSVDINNYHIEVTEQSTVEIKNNAVLASKTYSKEQVSQAVDYLKDAFASSNQIQGLVSTPGLNGVETTFTKDTLESAIKDAISAGEERTLHLEGVAQIDVAKDGSIEVTRGTGEKAKVYDDVSQAMDDLKDAFATNNQIRGAIATRGLNGVETTFTKDSLEAAIKDAIDSGQARTMDLGGVAKIDVGADGSITATNKNGAAADVFNKNELSQAFDNLKDIFKNSKNIIGTVSVVKQTFSGTFDTFTKSQLQRLVNNALAQGKDMTIIFKDSSRAIVVQDGGVTVIDAKNKVTDFGKQIPGSVDQNIFTDVKDTTKLGILASDGPISFDSISRTGLKTLLEDAVREHIPIDVIVKDSMVDVIVKSDGSVAIAGSDAEGWYTPDRIDTVLQKIDSLLPASKTIDVIFNGEDLKASYDSLKQKISDTISEKAYAEVQLSGKTSEGTIQKMIQVGKDGIIKVLESNNNKQAPGFKETGEFNANQIDDALSAAFGPDEMKVSLKISNGVATFGKWTADELNKIAENTLSKGLNLDMSLDGFKVKIDSEEATLTSRTDSSINEQMPRADALNAAKKGMLFQKDATGTILQTGVAEEGVGFLSVVSDLAMVVIFADMTTQVATGNMPLGLTTPTQLQNTIGYVSGGIFAGIAVNSIAEMVMAGEVISGWGAEALLASAVDPVTLAAATIALTAIETGPILLANSQTNPSGLGFISPTGQNVVQQVAISLIAGFSGLASTAQNNLIFDSLYRAEREKIELSSPATAQVITHTGSPQGAGGEIQVTQVSTEDAINHVAWLSAISKFDVSTITGYTSDRNHAPIYSDAKQMWNDLENAKSPEEVTAIDQKLRTAYAQKGITIPGMDLNQPGVMALVDLFKIKQTIVNNNMQIQANQAIIDTLTAANPVTPQATYRGMPITKVQTLSMQSGALNLENNLLANSKSTAAIITELKSEQKPIVQTESDGSKVTYAIGTSGTISRTYSNGWVDTYNDRTGNFDVTGITEPLFGQHLTWSSSENAFVGSSAGTHISSTLTPILEGQSQTTTYTSETEIRTVTVSAQVNQLTITTEIVDRVSNQPISLSVYHSSDKTTIYLNPITHIPTGDTSVANQWGGQTYSHNNVPTMSTDAQNNVVEAYIDGHTYTLVSGNNYVNENGDPYTKFDDSSGFHFLANTVTDRVGYSMTLDAAGIYRVSYVDSQGVTHNENYNPLTHVSVNKAIDPATGKEIVTTQTDNDDHSVTTSITLGGVITYIGTSFTNGIVIDSTNPINNVLHIPNSFGATLSSPGNFFNGHDNNDGSITGDNVQYGYGNGGQPLIAAHATVTVGYLGNTKQGFSVVIFDSPGPDGTYGLVSGCNGCPSGWVGIYSQSQLTYFKNHMPTIPNPATQGSTAAMDPATGGYQGTFAATFTHGGTATNAPLGQTHGTIWIGGQHHTVVQQANGDWVDTTTGKTYVLIDGYYHPTTGTPPAGTPSANVPGSGWGGGPPGYEGPCGGCAGQPSTFGGEGVPQGTQRGDTGNPGGNPGNGGNPRANSGGTNPGQGPNGNPEKREPGDSGGPKGGIIASQQISNFLNNLLQRFLQIFNAQNNTQATNASVSEISTNQTVNMNITFMPIIVSVKIPTMTIQPIAK